MKTWYDRIQNVYGSLDELKIYNENFGIAKRCGYKSCKKLWEDNPMVGGSVNPNDFGVIENFDPKVYLNCAKRLDKMEEMDYCCFIIEGHLREKGLEENYHPLIFCNLYDLDYRRHQSFEDYQYANYPELKDDISKEFRVLALLMAYQYYKK